VICEGCSVPFGIPEPLIELICAVRTRRPPHPRFARADRTRV